MYSSRTDMLIATIFVFVALTPILESYSASVSLQKQDLSSSQTSSFANSLKSDSDHASKPNKRKFLKISKNLFNKLVKNQEQLEQEADEEVLLSQSLPPPVQEMDESAYNEELGTRNIAENLAKFEHDAYEEASPSSPRPAYKEELRNNKIVTFLPANVHSSYWEDEEEIVPYYDCPLYRNSNPDGSAIVKADPFDCGCGYYCDWGVHKVQCCSWPLLWNQDIKNCDWYFNVRCRTYNSLRQKQ